MSSDTLFDLFNPTAADCFSLILWVNLIDWLKKWLCIAISLVWINRQQFPQKYIAGWQCVLLCILLCDKLNNINNHCIIIIIFYVLFLKYKVIKPACIVSIKSKANNFAYRSEDMNKVCFMALFVNLMF